MSSLVFVHDSRGTPLMPMAPALARKLMAAGKAVRQPHHAFTVLQLTRPVEQPHLRPLVLGVAIHLRTAELFLVAETAQGPRALLHVIIDLATELPRRLRRRAAHRRRRKARGRYRVAARHGVPYKLRRPSLQASSWGRWHHRRQPVQPTAGSRVTPTIRWRIEAIGRTIDALRSLAPISQVILVKPLRVPRVSDSEKPAKPLLERLIAMYGAVLPSGKKVAQCAYCRSVSGRIEADHIFPKSRGGSDAWPNRVLSCARCNALKGDQTPEEAGMRLLVAPVQEHSPLRHRPYTAETAAGLLRRLQAAGLQSNWTTSGERPPADIVSEGVWAVLQSVTEALDHEVTRYVAKPISRPAKQRYTSRNYSLLTATGSGFVRVRQAVKRLTRVNKVLIRASVGRRTKVAVVRVDESEADKIGERVRLGMLCRGLRAGSDVVGIVQAIHSDGRVTLNTPNVLSTRGVSWKRIVVGTRRAFRLISTDRVLFLPSPSSA